MNSEAPILFFDGDCALCHGAVRRLLRWEKPHGGAPILFSPLQGRTARALRAEGRLTPSTDAVVLLRGGTCHCGEQALGEALHLIGRTGWARAFRLWPAFLRRIGYRFVAQRRKAWFGQVSKGCPLPAEPGRMLP